MSCKLKSSLPRRYLKKDTKKKLSRLRDVLQRILSWIKEKLPEKQNAAVSSAEVLPEQVVNGDREVNNRNGCSLHFLRFRKNQLTCGWEGGRWEEG